MPTPVDVGPTLQAIGFTIAGGSIVLLTTFLFFGIAVRARSPNIAPRCTAREDDVIYNPHARPEKSRLAWCWKFACKCFKQNKTKKKLEDDENYQKSLEDMEGVDVENGSKNGVGGVRLRRKRAEEKEVEQLIHDQYRGGPTFGWIPWTLGLSYEKLLSGVPGTGTRQNGAKGTLLKVNLDGIVLLRYHAIGLRVAILATVLCIGIILPLNITARCWNDSTSSYCEDYEFSNFEQTTLKNIPPLDLSQNNTTMSDAKTFAAGFFGTSTKIFGSEYSTYLGRLYGVVIVSWTLVIYTLRALKNEWEDALALRRVYYLEGEHWENRKRELEETYIAASTTADEDDNDPAEGLGDAMKRRRQINMQKKKMNNNNLMTRDPWIPHPEQRETVPNIELYSVLVGQIPSKPREVMDEEDMVGLKNDENQELDWQLAVTTTFFDHCVPNQPGFSSSVAAVTILPDAPKLALAWRMWYKHVGLLRRLRFIRTLIAEMRDYDIDRVNDENPSDRHPLPTPPRKSPSETTADLELMNQADRNKEEIQQRIDYYKNVLGSGRHDEDVESLLVHALNYGPEQTAVYAREFAQGAAACCPNGCGEEKLRTYGIDQLVELEEEIKEKVEASFKELLEAQTKNIMSKNETSIHENLSSHEMDLPPLQAKRTVSVEKASADVDDNLEIKLMQMGPKGTGKLQLPPVPGLSPNPYTLSPPPTSPNKESIVSMETARRGNLPGPPLNSVHPTDKRLTVSNEYQATTRGNTTMQPSSGATVATKNSHNSNGNNSTGNNSTGNNSHGNPFPFHFPFGQPANQQDSLSPLNQSRTNRLGAMTMQGKVSLKGPASFEEADTRLIPSPTPPGDKSYIPDLLDAPHQHQTNHAPFPTPSDNSASAASGRNRLGTGYSFRTMNSNEDRKSANQWTQYQQIRSDDRAAKGIRREAHNEPFSGVWEYPTVSAMKKSAWSFIDDIKGWAGRKKKNVVDDFSSESTFAVVTFTSRQAAVAARHCLSDGRGANRWIPTNDIPVPPLADAAVCDFKTCRGCCRPVTLTVNPKQQLMRKYITFMTLVTLYVFYTVPITIATTFVAPKQLVKVFPKLQPVLDENEFLERFLSGFAPALFFSIFFAICPVIFKTISNFGSNAVSVNQAEFSALQYYWYFMLFTAFSGTSLASMGIKFFRRQNENNGLTDLLVEIAGTLPTQVSAIWLNWIIVRTFITLPLQYMLQVNTYLFQWLGWKCCRRCVMGGGPGGPIPYRIYIDSGVVFLCLIALSPVCPLIAPTALIYFLYCSPLWRRNLIFMYRPKFDTGGLRWPFLADVFIQSIVVAQVLLTTVMALKQAIGPAVLAAIPIIPTLIQRRSLRKRYLKSYLDAALLQTSLLDGWDNSSGTSFEKREGFRQFLVDAHKAAYVPICIAGGAVSTALTAEPAVVVDYEYDNPNAMMAPLVPDGEGITDRDIHIPDLQTRPSNENTAMSAATPRPYLRANRQFGASMRRMPRLFSNDDMDNRSRTNTHPYQFP